MLPRLRFKSEVNEVNPYIYLQGNGVGVDPGQIEFTKVILPGLDNLIMHIIVAADFLSE